VQTISYLPHFVSWVVVAGMFSQLLSTDGGIVNNILLFLHIIKEPVQFLAKPELFWGIVTIADLWKELGWSTIIFLAAMTAIDPTLYEAAIADGAGRFRRMWHITLPGIRSTFIVLLIMSIGWLTSIGFEKQILLGNTQVQDYSYVLDLYVLRYGLQLMRFSFGTAVGMANSIVSILLLYLSNKLAKRFDEGTLV
jgi:putative aldouronate transport system permease protein